MDWRQTASLPGYGGARRRRSTSIGEAVRAAEQTDAATAVLAFAVMAARSTDQGTITVPAHDDTHWRAITVDLGTGSTTAGLHQVVVEQLAGPPVSRPPPPNRAVVVLGDHPVDGSHVALRIRPDGIELEGPVEPTGGISVLAQRLSWLTELVSVDRAIDTIAPIPPDDRARTLAHRSGADLRPIRHVLTEIERTARRAPHATAITTPWTSLSYDDLMNVTGDRHAMLRRRGIGPGATVGLDVTRSADLVATMLAIWNTGASFVPITTSQPRARVLEMLRLAGASRVVTDLGGWRRPSRTVAPVDVDRQVSDRRIRRRRTPPRALDTAAWTVFVSSDEGPRGIAVSHRRLSHYLQAITLVMPGTGGHGVMLASTPIGADSSMLELIWPLIRGWEVVIDPRRDIAIGPVVRRRQVTHFNTTPTMVALMMRSRDGREILETVRHLLIGDEEVRAEHVADLRSVTKAQITVRYGPPECTVDTAWGIADSGITAGALPVGRPLPGHRADIIDRRQQLLGAFQIGDLVVVGDSVTDGYVGRVASPSPFSRRDGAPAFRTGDSAWSDARGTIQIVGRDAGHVDVRGHRIALAEVDARLAAHRSIAEAATVVIGTTERRHLEAFVVPREDASDEALALWMQETLPEPMVPSIFHRLDHLPLNGSRAPDPAALSHLADARAQRRQDRRSLTSTEARVATVFEDVLGVRQVPPDQSLFDLGGTSASATSLVCALESLIGRRVPMATLLVDSSVERLAAAIDEGRLGGDPQTLVPIRPGGQGLPVYCVPGPDGHAAALRPLGEALGRPFFGLEFAGTDGLSSPDSTIEAMADRFALAVREDRGDRPVVVAGYAGGGLVALEMARRLGAAGTRVMLVVLIDTMNPQLESRSIGRRFVDGLRELRAPDDMAAIRVLRNRVVTDRLTQQENLLAVLRRGRLPDLVDLTPDFHRAAADWTPPSHDGPVLVIRSHTVVPANRGWDRVVAGPLEAISVDAGHVGMMLPPHVDDLATGLRRAIERVERAHRR